MALFLPGCEWQRPASTAPALPVRLGITGTLFAAPLLVAREMGYFAEEGLAVTFTEYPFGKKAMEGLLVGEVDVIPVGDTPIVMSSFSRDDFVVLATFAQAYDHSKVIARRDKGIATPADLAGKRVGATQGVTAHFYLHLFLLNHGLRDADITLVNLPQNELAGTLAAGKVEAVAAFEPYAWQVAQGLGQQALTFPPTRLFRETYSLVAARSFASKHPETLQRLLRAIDRAVAFMGSNREQALAMVGKALGADDNFLAGVWDSYAFGLVLDQTLLMTMESEARWAMGQKMTTTKEVPDYLRFLDQRPLRATKPEAVKIIQ